MDLFYVRSTRTNAGSLSLMLDRSVDERARMPVTPSSLSAVIIIKPLYRLSRLQPSATDVDRHQSPKATRLRECKNFFHPS